jgi:AraC-like DNA-binding protein
MLGISQKEATEAIPVARGEVTRFWRDERFAGMECMRATFLTHEFAPHAHDTFSIGAIEAGCQIAMIRGQREHTGPGALYLINPGEMHDGQPGVEEGYRYRMIYPDVGYFTSVLEDVTGLAFHGTPAFSRQLLDDPELAARFHLAHGALENGESALESEERMFSVLAAMFQRHGSQILSLPRTAEPTAIRRARDFIDVHFAEEISLERLASISGLSRAHMIRAFRKAFFITPHAYQTDLRIRDARRRLRRGDAIADTALACGFADQAHFSRHFKARTGVTPAVFRSG